MDHQGKIFQSHEAIRLPAAAARPVTNTAMLIPVINMIQHKTRYDTAQLKSLRLSKKRKEKRVGSGVGVGEGG